MNAHNLTHQALFCVHSLCFIRERRQILKNISFHLKEGEVLSILGTNGAGKTTLLKAMLGLLPCQSGQSFLYQKPIQSYGKSLWQHIGYVAQAKTNVFNLKVLDMVTLGFNPVVRFTPKTQHFQQSLHTLETLHIAHLAHKHCHALSGGELQMVLFARALVCRPKLLVLDEPESNLDFANQKIIIDTLKHLSKQGCAIILNTHFPSHALYLSHKALLLKNTDTILESTESNCLFGDAKNILTQENLSALYNVPLFLHDKPHHTQESHESYTIYL